MSHRYVLHADRPRAVRDGTLARRRAGECRAAARALAAPAPRPARDTLHAAVDRLLDRHLDRLTRELRAEPTNRDAHTEPKPEIPAGFELQLAR